MWLAHSQSGPPEVYYKWAGFLDNFEMEGQVKAPVRVFRQCNIKLNMTKNGCRGIASLLWWWQFLKDMDYMSWNEVSIQFIKRRKLQLPKICYHDMLPSHWVGGKQPLNEWRPSWAKLISLENWCGSIPKWREGVNVGGEGGGVYV